MTESPKTITSHFYLNDKDYDGEIYIVVNAKDPELRRKLMNGVSFDTYSHTLEYEGRSEVPNTLTISRQIFVKKKKNDLKKENIF
jgi:hypothetical protein